MDKLTKEFFESFEDIGDLDDLDTPDSSQDEKRIYDLLFAALDGVIKYQGNRGKYFSETLRRSRRPNYYLIDVEGWPLAGTFIRITIALEVRDLENEEYEILSREGGFDAYVDASTLEVITIESTHSSTPDLDSKFFEAVGDDMNLDDVDLPDETSKENYKDNRLKIKAAYKALEYLQKQVAPYCNIKLDTLTEGDYNYFVVAENWPTVKAKKTKLDLTIVDRDYSNTIDIRSGSGGFSIELNRTTLEVNLFDTSEAFDNGLNRFKIAARAAQTGEVQNDDDFRKQLTQVLKGLGFNRISVLKNEEGAILSFYKDALQEMTDIVKQQGWDKRGIEVRKYGHNILLDIPFLAPGPNTPAPKPSKRGSSNKSVRP